ncbi:MAG: HEAT repeat domain-containing protein [Mariprofundaceae bacterium]
MIELQMDAEKNDVVEKQGGDFTLTSKQQAVDALIHALNTGDEVHRCFAAQALGNIGDAKAVPALTDHVQDADLDVAMDSVEALGKLGDTSPVPLLIDGLNLADVVDIRINAAEALGKLGGEGAVEALIAALRMDLDITENEDMGGWDPSWDINKKAIEGLGRIGDARAVEPLASMLDDEGAIDAEVVILKSLAGCGDAGRHAVIRRLKEHADARGRRRCALALSDADSDLAREALADALLDDDADVRLYAARALAGFNDPAHLIPLLMLLKDQEAEVRAEAVEIAARVGGARAIDKVIPMLADESVAVCLAAIEALGELRAGQAVEGLLALVQEGDEGVRRAAIEALGKIGNEQAREPLLDILGNSEVDEMLRAAVPAALAGLVDEKVLAALRDAVGDDSKLVRSMSMMALKDIDHPGARDALLAALHGELLPPEQAEEQVIEDAKQKDEGVIETVAEEEAVEAGEPAVDQEQDEPPESEHWPDSTLASIAQDKINAEKLAAQVKENNESFELSGDIIEFVDIAKANRKRKKASKPGAIAPHQDVRLFAARLLADVHGEDVIEALCDCLNAEDAALKQEAVTSLGRAGRSGHAAVTSHLLPLLDNEDRSLSFEVIRALGRLGGDGVAEALLEQLRDADGFIRRVAAEALEGFSDEAVVGALRERLLNEKDLGVRLACAKSLAAIGDGRAVEDIVQAAFLEGGEQRHEMGRILRDFDPDAATQALVATLMDETKADDHRAAIEAVAEIHRI